MEVPGGVGTRVPIEPMNMFGVHCYTLQDIEWHRDFYGGWGTPEVDGSGFDTNEFFEHVLLPDVKLRAALDPSLCIALPEGLPCYATQDVTEPRYAWGVYDEAHKDDSRLDRGEWTFG